jgi:hypothetical protein
LGGKSDHRKDLPKQDNTNIKKLTYINTVLGIRTRDHNEYRSTVITVLLIGNVTVFRDVTPCSLVDRY